MTEKPSPRVSMEKSGAGGKASDPTAPSSKPSPPRTVRWATFALVLAGVSAVVTSLDLVKLEGWLRHTANTANKKLKLKDRKTTQELHSSVTSTVHVQIFASIILLVALVLVARAVWTGRYWSRWAVIGLWLLASLTSTFAGFTWIFSIGQSQPAGFKIPLLIGVLSFAAAVVLCCLRPSSAYFNLSRPARPARPGRRGMFAVGDLVRESESLPGAGPIRGRPTRAERISAARQASAERAARRAGSRGGATAQPASSADGARSRARTSKSRRSGA